MCHTPTRNKQGESHHYCTATEYIFKPEMSTGSQQTALHTCLPIHGVKQPTIHWLHPLPQRSCEHRCSLWRPFKTRKPGFQWKKRCYVWRFLPLESKIIFKSRSNCIVRAWDSISSLSTPSRRSQQEMKAVAVCDVNRRPVLGVKFLAVISPILKLSGQTLCLHIVYHWQNRKLFHVRFNGIKFFWLYLPCPYRF